MTNTSNRQSESAGLVLIGNASHAYIFDVVVLTDVHPRSTLQRGSPIGVGAFGTDGEVFPDFRNKRTRDFGAR